MTFRVAITKKFNQLKHLILVAVLVLGSVIPLLAQHKVNAYSLPSLRFIKLSSSKQADTNVIYSLGFTTNSGGSSASTGGMVIDFCSNSPIIGDSCTAPTGFDTVKATLALGAQSGITGWSVDTTNSTVNKIVLTRTASSITSGTVVSVELGTVTNGITNPNNTNTTFFGRVITYDTGANAGSYTSTALGSGAIDAGGMAMSTAAQITVTAKVPEKLTFCVYTSASSNNCTAVSGTAVTLGDTNGVLSDTGPFVDKNAKYTISTNALSGVAIRIKGTTLKTSAGCAEPPASNNCSIDAIGAVAASSAAGTEQFGFCTYQSAGTGITPASPYNNANCSTTTQTAGTGSTGGAGTAQFAFDNNSTTGTTSTYGHTFANSVASTFSTGIIAFIGNISTITEPGIYTTTLTFIATGTY